MRETEEVKFENRKNQTNKGITLIALVITIIVMLILVAVTITMAVNGGLFQKASEAGQATNEAVANEQILASGQVTIEGATYNSIDEFIEATKGIEDKSITVTSSEQEIKFEKTITKTHVSYEKKDYQTYEIKGISLEEDGEYITTGKLTGKSGELEIVGDIKDTTFVYNLTDFMKGDEVFFCKINIDGEEYLQKLQVIQGESIYYEEKYFDIELSLWDYSTDAWKPEPECGTYLTNIQGELWNGGEAFELNWDYDACFNINFDFVGSKADLIWGQTEKNFAPIYILRYRSDGSPLTHYFTTLKSESLGIYEYSIEMSDTKGEQYTINLQLAYDPGFDPWDFGYSKIVIDGIRIWK